MLCVTLDRALHREREGERAHLGRARLCLRGREHREDRQKDERPPHQQERTTRTEPASLA